MRKKKIENAVIGTAPVWALPVAIGGGVLAVAGASVGGYKIIKLLKQKRNSKKRSLKKTSHFR